MTSLIGIFLALVAIGIGPIAFRPVTPAWGAQDAVHDHNHESGTTTPTPTDPQTPPAPTSTGMMNMRAEMMARMTAADTQLKTLMAEVNSAKTTDAKVAAMTKVLNVMVEQRAMMRAQMDMQGKMMQDMMPMMRQMMHPPAP